MLNELHMIYYYILMINNRTHQHLFPPWYYYSRLHCSWRSGWWGRSYSENN